MYVRVIRGQKTPPKISPNLNQFFDWREGGLRAFEFLNKYLRGKLRALPKNVGATLCRDDAPRAPPESRHKDAPTLGKTRAPVRTKENEGRNDRGAASFPSLPSVKSKPLPRSGVDRSHLKSRRLGQGGLPLVESPELRRAQHQRRRDVQDIQAARAQFVGMGCA